MELTEFTQALRTALSQLDDFERLRQNPLLALLARTGGPATPLALQQRLIQEIEALNSAPQTPAQVWDVLYFRYVNQLSQEQVAYQLGVSIRQLRRIQNRAVEHLAERLWSHFGFDGQSVTPINPAVAEEANWLREEFAGEVSHVPSELTKAVQDSQPLAQRYAVRIEHSAELEHCLAPIPPQVLHQALLTILTTAIRHAQSHTLTVDLATHGAEVQFQLALVGAPDSALSLAHCWPLLTTVDQLLAPFAGKLSLTEAAPPSISLTLPTIASVPVLMVEDNPDTRRLFQRYLTHSRYRLITTDDGREAIALAQQHGVRALVLDVMMYQVSGWDLLSEWCHHPATKAVPVAVCSILPQEELAHLLGAKAFLQKPVNQQMLLAALDGLTQPSRKRRG
jgi:CheY-like chemotaxis protein/transcriptional regulator with XRE-family HTH domain